MKRLKELEAENRRLKKMYADERLKAEIVQEALEKVVKHLCVKRWSYRLLQFDMSPFASPAKPLVSVSRVTVTKPN